MLQNMPKEMPAKKTPGRSTMAANRSLPIMEPNPLFPRRRGRPSLAARRLQEEEAAAAQAEAAEAAEEDTEELSAKQKASVTKNIAERKKKLLMELEHPRKSPREHASTLAILSCLLQQRQLNSEQQGRNKRRKSTVGSEVEEASSEEKNSETASERRDSHCTEQEEKKKSVADETAPEEEDLEEDEEGSEAMAVTTTDGDTTETEQQQEKKKRRLDQENLVHPMTPRPIPVSSRTATPLIPGLKRSNSSMSNQSSSKGSKKKKKKHLWRARDSINPQELNKEIELLLADPLNASAESIDSKLLDKSDDFLLPFHECPDFSELVLSVDADDLRQSYVRKSFAPRRSLKAAPTKSNILQLDYQLRSAKKRKRPAAAPLGRRTV